MRHLPIRILRLPGVEITDEPIFASQPSSALLNFAPHLVGAAIGRPIATVLPAPTGRADAVCVSAIIHYSSFIIHWGRSQTAPLFLPSPQAPQGEANVVRCKTQRRTCVTRNVTVSTSPSNRTTPNFSGVLPACVAVTVSTAPSTPGNRNMRIRRCPNAPLKY